MIFYHLQDDAFAKLIKETGNPERYTISKQTPLRNKSGRRCLSDEQSSTDLHITMKEGLLKKSVSLGNNLNDGPEQNLQEGIYSNIIEEVKVYIITFI